MGFKEIGFDVGILAGEDNCYSTIFHEVLFGKHPDMVAFRSSLNQPKLFASFSDATEFLQQRAALIRSGADLESDDGDEFGIVRVAAPYLTLIDRVV